MQGPSLSQVVANLQERMVRVEMAMKSMQEGAPVPKRMMTYEEAASFLGMTVDGLRGLAYRKIIPYYKPNGKNVYFDVDELVAWQKRHHFEPMGSHLEKTPKSE